VTAFLDTNVILRHLLQDVPHQSARSTGFLSRVERNEITVVTSDLVVFETVYVLERTVRTPKQHISDTLLPIIQLPAVQLPGKSNYPAIFDLYVRLNISFPDAFHAVHLRRAGIDEVVSFDRDFDRVPWVKRVEPDIEAGGA
jgi:predicted nucleic acid-binding protein